ncbi:unnamed protein product [Brassica rapa subsp. trilocularis]
MTRFRRLQRSRSCARFSKTRRVDSPPEGVNPLVDFWGKVGDCSGEMVEKAIWRLCVTESEMRSYGYTCNEDLILAG